jgi:hypothetical protein
LEESREQTGFKKMVSDVFACPVAFFARGDDFGLYPAQRRSVHEGDEPYFVLRALLFCCRAHGAVLHGGQQEILFKTQWISIVAVLSSLSVTALVDGVIAIGSLTGLNVLKGIKGVKAIKAIKGMKGLKLFKATKGAKVAKSVKLAKKAKKAHYEARAYERKGE